MSVCKSLAAQSVRTEISSVPESEILPFHNGSALRGEVADLGAAVEHTAHAD